MKPRQNSYQCNIYIIYVIDTITDFLIKLGMKPCLHLVKISIFSLNNVTVRLIKIMNNLLEHFKILIFKVMFQCGKVIESYKKNYLKYIGLNRRPTFDRKMFLK